MNKNETGKLWSGVMFIILGFIFLLQEFFPQLDFTDFWPVLLIITGIIVIYDGYIKPQTSSLIDESVSNTKNEKQNEK